MTLPKILISNFHPEIDVTQNSSINFTWQIGNKYEIISEKLNLVGTFGLLECAPNLAASLSILQDLQLLVLENTGHQSL